MKHSIEKSVKQAKNIEFLPSSGSPSVKEVCSDRNTPAPSEQAKQTTVSKYDPDIVKVVSTRKRNLKLDHEVIKR